MRTLWIKIACFLTGYDYKITQQCSEETRQVLKKYIAALIILMFLWGFIGYVFSERYLGLSLFGGIIGALIMIIAIIQVERQIILSVKLTIGAKIARILLALLMALIGAVIIDQFLFKDDIELEKISYIEDKIKQVRLKRIEEYKNNSKETISRLDSLIKITEKQQKKAQEACNKRPKIKIITRSIKETKDTTGEVVSNEREYNEETTTNPQCLQATTLLQTLNKMRTNRNNIQRDMQDKIQQIDNDVRIEYQGKTGFLDELKIMYKVVTSDIITIVVYFMIFLFLGLLELLVLMTKSAADDRKNEYKAIIEHHKENILKGINKLNNG